MERGRWMAVGGIAAVVLLLLLPGLAGATAPGSAPLWLPLAGGVKRTGMLLTLGGGALLLISMLLLFATRHRPE